MLTNMVVVMIPALAFGDSSAERALVQEIER
jgi:hypothetical protein